MAQQIKSFGMSAMTIGSCSDFHTQVNKLITAATPAALHVAEKAAAYSDSTALLASIVNRQRSFIATASLPRLPKSTARATMPPESSAT